MKVERRGWLLGLAAALALAGVACGEASYQGYNAPIGSTVIMPEARTLQINAQSSAVVSVSVIDAEGSPLNGVQVQMGCFMCVVYHRVDGSCDLIGGDTELQLMPEPFFVKTNSLGQCQVRLVFEPPSTYSAPDYTAIFSANIGVGGPGETEITIEQLE